MSNTIEVTNRGSDFQIKVTTDQIANGGSITAVLNDYLDPGAQDMTVTPIVDDDGLGRWLINISKDQTPFFRLDDTTNIVITLIKTDSTVEVLSPIFFKVDC